MKKIHEQEWKTRHTNIGPIIDDVSGHPEGEAVCLVYGRYGKSYDPTATAGAAFIAAAPKMARALLAQVKDLHREGCACMMCAALRAAGVLP